MIIKCKNKKKQIPITKVLGTELKVYIMEAIKTLLQVVEIVKNL